MQETGIDPWVGKIPWRSKWQPVPVFLPGKFNGQRSLAGYSPWSSKESDTTEQQSTRTIDVIQQKVKSTAFRRPEIPVKTLKNLTIKMTQENSWIHFISEFKAPD